VSIWAAHQGRFALAEVDCDAPESAVVLRQGLAVLVLPAPPGATALVQALQQGHPLGAAAALAMAGHAAFDLAHTLAGLMAHGAFCPPITHRSPAP
jgi:hypothetical protein